MTDEKIIVSACLAGLRCRYDGETKPCEKVVEMVAAGKALPVCPEQLGGLPTPRVPAEMRGGRVVRQDGVDVTPEFVHGAQESLMLAQLVGATKAILKSRSPSCGSEAIYDGSFSGKLIPGDGVTAALFKANGIHVITEEDL